MVKSKVLGSIGHSILGISAIFAERIKVYNEKKGLNYELIIALFYNGIFSAFFSGISSFFMALVLYPLTNTFLINWSTLFKIIIILSSLLLLVNLLSKKLNVPIMFLQVMFFLKSKYKSFEIFMLYVLVSYTVLMIVAYMLFQILFNIFIQYGFKVEIATIISFIVAGGLTVAGFYAFPVEKNDRDINELIISPIYIALNIGIGYFISKQNIINNAKQGNEDMVSSLLILYLITACIQVITYFKKFFEKLHDLSSYDKNVRIYSKMTRRKLSFFKRHLEEQVTVFNQVFKELKLIKKDKSFYLFFGFVGIFIFGIISIKALGLYELNTIVTLNNSISKIIGYIILFGFLLFLSIKLFTFLILLLKEKNILNRRQKWGIFSISLFIFGILISMIALIFFKRLSTSITIVSVICFTIATIIFYTNSFIDWLLSKK